MNRPCDQLLAGAGFSLDQYSGVGWRNLFDFGEHRFQGGAVAYDLLESALTAFLVTGPRFFEGSRISLHRGPPCEPGCTLPLLGSTFQGCSNTIKQGFVVEWFG